MPRQFPDWITAYCEYSSYTEAPQKLRFWAAVSALAGALRRKVWIDQYYFRWFPNFFIIFVSKPGIVQKSTTVDVALDLLREVKGVHFGPDILTWQTLPPLLASVAEEFTVPSTGEIIKMSALTCAASEFGNFIKPKEQEMVDMLVSLWDGRKKFDKRTKNSGNDALENPWINLIGCTTPAWISGNFPEYMVGGGFASRCVLVHVSDKEKFIAYPGLHIPEDIEQTRDMLTQDLEHISLYLAGEYALTRDAIAWGEAWYENLWKKKPENLSDDRLSGYIARKQTHIHKLAMVLAAAKRDKLVITEPDLIDANTYVSALEGNITSVFGLVGRTEVSLNVDKLLDFIRRRGEVGYDEAYRYVHSYFPDAREFASAVDGVVKAGFARMVPVNGKMLLIAIK
jgi:uncharacterized protein DUF3987